MYVTYSLKHSLERKKGTTHLDFLRSFIGTMEVLENAKKKIICWAHLRSSHSFYVGKGNGWLLGWLLSSVVPNRPFLFLHFLIPTSMKDSKDKLDCTFILSK